MFIFTACEEAGCEAEHPVCRAAANECDIQCGAGQYRHGHYCYHCDGSGPCKTCDGAGLCEACNEGYGMRRGECRSMEQIGLDRIAAELGEGCTSPDLLTSLEAESSGGGECGTFDITMDLDSRAVLTLFVNGNRHHNE